MQVSIRLWLLLAALFALFGSGKADAQERPNVVVIMVDDLGFSDLGCYGGEIETPNLDRLAAGGLRFSQFYNTAKCHSSRVSLLTGAYCIQAGDIALTKGITSAEVLSKAGYFTMMTGKWHLKRQPTDLGFGRFFGHLSGACNYYLGDGTFRLNGEKWNVPKEGFYTTVANVDYAIKFLAEARKTDKPWYLYVAFNAPHAPLQPLEEDFKKYEGRYSAGWDIVREKRIEKQAKLGLFGKEVVPSPRPEHVRAWDKLSPKWKHYESRRMAAIAGIIDRVDQEVGRLVADLKKAGELENTMILFISDNGACPFDQRSHTTNPDSSPFAPNVRWGDSTGWAWMRNSPFRYYKQNQFEGGISSPAIVHWPAGLKAYPRTGLEVSSGQERPDHQEVAGRAQKTQAGAIVHDPAHLVDVLPTLAEICDAPIPSEWPGRTPTKVSGVSLAPIFSGKRLEKRPPIHFLFESDRALRDGDWKIVSFRNQPWELYNLAEDRSEMEDLAAKHPKRLAELVSKWHDMAENVLEAPSSAREPVAANATEQHNDRWSKYDRDPGRGRSKKPTPRR